MARRNLAPSRRVFFAVVALLVSNRIAYAEPFCPGTHRTHVFANTLDVGGVFSRQHSLSDVGDQMWPCDEMLVEISATDFGWYHPNQEAQYGTALNISFKTLDGVNDLQPMPGFGVPTNQTVTTTYPPAYPGKPGAYQGLRYPGTALLNTRLKHISIEANAITGGVNYTLAVHLKSRAGYNRGGTNAATALTIQNTGLVLHGTLRTNEDQYYKVTLPPGGTVSASGTITH